MRNETESRPVRVENLWSHCADWFRGEDGERSELLFHFHAIELDDLEITLRTIDREALLSTTNVVWRDREAFDPAAENLDASIEHFRAGHLAGLGLTYLYELERFAVRILLTVLSTGEALAEDEDEGLCARVYTKLGLVIPDDEPKQERFEVLLAHVEHLAELFDPAEVSVAPSRDEGTVRVVVEFK